MALERFSSLAHPWRSSGTSWSATREGCDEAHGTHHRSIIVVAALFAMASAVGQTPSWMSPPDSARCPTKWGAGDERGSGNHMGPKSVLNAAKLIKTGEVIELSHVLHDGMPISRTRRFEVFTKRATEFLGSNRRGSNEELVVSEIGQVGTQFDGFAHQTHEDSFYNCFKMEGIAMRTGFKKLGIEKVGALITRGVLIDESTVSPISTALGAQPAYPR
jgi:hypothetical protein